MPEVILIYRPVKESFFFLDLSPCSEYLIGCFENFDFPDVVRETSLYLYYSNTINQSVTNAIFSTLFKIQVYVEDFL